MQSLTTEEITIISKFDPCVPCENRNNSFACAACEKWNIVDSFDPFTIVKDFRNQKEILP